MKTLLHRSFAFGLLAISACSYHMAALADETSSGSVPAAETAMPVALTDSQPGSTQEICPQPTPPGWVIVSTRPCAGCCGSSGTLVQMQTIRKIEGMKPGSTVEICPLQATPSGWVVVSIRPCAGCCGASGDLAQMRTIKKVDGLPSGTTLEMCPQPTPPGWVLVSSRPCAGCCGASGNLAQMPTIKKL